MRELTEYEKKKWFDQRGRFDAPELLMDGSELGEAYETIERITRMKDYGVSEEFVKAAQAECLDMYYGQIEWIYELEQEDPEELGLPSVEELLNQGSGFGYEEVEDIGLGRVIGDDIHRKLWDWAMDWREEHLEETINRQRKERLQRELESLG